jgi:hexosaminidase
LPVTLGQLDGPPHDTPATIVLPSFTLKFMSRLRIFASSALVALATLCSSAQSLHLIPTPREVQPGATQPLTQGLHITCTSCFNDPDDTFTVQDLTQAFAARAIPTAGPFTIQLTRVQTLPDEMKPEGYTISPGPSTLTLAASTSAGLFYAAQTLKQLVEHDGSSAVLHLATIRDWPAMKYRGVHDDLSRGPVPTLEFQKKLIRTLAAYKINLYSPYFEHTQQYAGNPLFAPPGGSLSAADARELSAYGAQYHVDVVPEQEAFGHLHRNLTWEQYQPLAETPHGAVLAPGQTGSIALIQQMFTELAALYPGPFLHIGADETADLGLGQTRADVDARGLGPVYLDFLQHIVTTLAPLHRRLLFWGDIAQSIVQGSTAYSAQAGASEPNRVDPNILKNLPQSFKQNTIAIAWWYTPQPKGFARFLTPFTSAGFETWVAPGVNNWNVIWPDDNDALPNIQQFIAEGQRQHSTGALTTIWYDDGEALANNNWYGLLFGAAASWQPGTSSIEAFQQSFAQAFHGDSTRDLNQAEIELMKCHAILREEAKVGDGSDGLFWLDPWSKDGQPRAAKLRPFAHDLRLHAEAALTLIAKARAAYPATLSQVGSSSRSAAEQSASAFPSYNPADAFPSNTTSLHNPDAIDAMELGARRMDFIGLKFQLADEIVQGYNQVLVAESSPDKKLRASVGPTLSEIRGVNGRLRDIIDTYSLLRDLYQQAWLRSNRPYALREVLERYDATIALWQSRDDRFRSAQRQLADSKTLPSASDLGLPPLR